MKIVKEKPQFQKTTITIESMEEKSLLHAICFVIYNDPTALNQALNFLYVSNMKGPKEKQLLNFVKTLRETV